MSDYETLFARSGDSMCELDARGRILHLNSACRALLGDTSEGDEQDLVQLFDEDGGERLCLTLTELSGDTLTAVFEGYLAAAGKWTSWQLTSMEPGRIIAVGRDITEHHRTAGALEEKSSFLHSIIEAEPECVKIVAADGELLDMNAAGLRMIGAESREEAIGANVYDLMAPEYRERFIEFNERVCAGEGGELSFDIIGLDETRRSMETIAVPLPQANGPVLHLAITRDVTQRHQLEQQLLQAQKMEAIGHLAGGVAHDFNNLLTAIIGPAELALTALEEDHDDKSEEVARDLREIKATGERAARLTQKLLAFARRQRVRLETISLAELVSGAKEMLERLLGETIQLEIDIETDASPVRADRGHMEQVLLNLVVNARDAIEESGRIHIEVFNEPVTAPRANRLGLKTGNYVALAVVDDGVGIPVDTMPQIFDPFFTTKPQGTGTGLGLSTSYGIVTQLDGAIEVRSQPGKGTEMIVLMPTGSVDTEASSDATLETAGDGKTVLVVEDETIVRNTIVRMLSTAGYSVHPAANGHEALAKAEQLTDLALVVTDMAMPGMGGRELVERLRRSRSVSALYLTGYLPGTAPQGGPKVGDDFVLNKPFSTEELRVAAARTLLAWAPSDRT